MYIYHSNGKNGYLQISRCKTYDEAVELYTKNYWDKFYKQLHGTYPNRRIESEAEFLETIDTLFYPAPWLPKNAWDAKPRPLPAVSARSIATCVPSQSSRRSWMRTFRSD